MATPDDVTGPVDDATAADIDIDIDLSDADALEVEDPDAGARAVERHDAEARAVERPDAGTSDVEAADVEGLDVEGLAVEGPDAGGPEVDAFDVDTAGPGGDDDAMATSEGPASGPGRWATVGGVLTLAYVVWYIGDLVLLSRNPRAYVTLHEVYGSLFMRLVFAGIFLGLVFHAVNGVRSTLIDFVPRLARRDLVLRAAVRFFTFAVWVPGAFVLVWPAIRSGFAR